MKSELATTPTNEQLIQGEFEIEHPMNGFRWEKRIQDTNPLTKIKIRQVNFKLFWNEGEKQYSYDADIYIKPK